MAYFKTVNYGNNLFGIWETLAVQSFLVIGEEKALLIDTGFGFSDISAYIKTLTDLPLTVVNSHVHPDHSMGNNRFAEVLVGKEDLQKLKNNILYCEFDTMLTFFTKWIFPLKLLVRHYEQLDKGQLVDTHYAPLIDGTKISLGKRDIGVLAMPGHTPGSLVFYDKKTGTLIVGDAVNRGCFLFLNKDLRLKQYANQLDKLAELEGCKTLLSSHSKAPVAFGFVKYYANFLRRVDVKKVKLSFMPLSENKVARYSEKSLDYGKISVYFNLGQEK